MRNHLPLTLGDTLKDNATRFANEPAYILGDRSLTHLELLQRGKKLSSALEKQGIKRQDRISILSMNSLEFTEVMAAGNLSGIIVATINFRLSPLEVEHIVNDSTPRVLFFEAQYLTLIEQIRDQLPTVEKFVCMGGSSDFAEDYETFLSQGNDEGSSFISTEEDIACLMYTSGTTGKPKGCILGQREIRIGVRIMAVETRCGPLDKLLLVMPLFHIGALYVGMGINSRGGSVVLHRQFDPGALIKTVNEQGVSILHLAPTLVQMVLDHPDIDTANFEKLHTLVYAAAIMPLPLLKRGIEKLGNVFVNLYGQTEVISSGLPREQHRPYGTEREKKWLTSVGYPFLDTLIRILDDEGNECPQGEPGEIVVKSANMARGYWNNHKATLETFRDGWCHTGDVGLLDEEGILYLVDRKKDVIVSGGENIYSREVEDALLTHSAISQCAVIGLPDEKWGESVCAVVVLKDNMAASDEDLIEHCKSLIARYKSPSSIKRVSEIAKMPTGKIDKKALRQQFTD